MCKALVIPHLNYGDMIYDEAYNEIFHWKPRSIQYDACLALSGAITGLSREKLYHKLGLESFQRWHWYKKLCLFYKIFKENKHVYLFNLIPIKKLDYNTGNIDKITLLHTKNNFFQTLFFPPTVIEWNKLDFSFWSVATLVFFKENLLRSLLDHLQTVFLIATTAKESNTS